MLELDDKHKNYIRNYIRNYIKDAYEAYGHLKGIKQSGIHIVDIDTAIKAYAQIITFAETIIDESHLNPKKEDSKTKTEKIKEILSKGSDS